MIDPKAYASPLPFPYQEVWARLPSRFKDMNDVAAQVLELYKREPWWPSGHEPRMRLAGGRFMVLRRLYDGPREYVCGYLGQDFRWVALATFPSLWVALWYREQWGRLTWEQTLKALWIHNGRGAVPVVWVPREARAWDRLAEDEQLLVWQTMDAGAPGRVLEVIEAARACGLF